jgi:hypothetical protein
LIQVLPQRQQTVLPKNMSLNDEATPLLLKRETGCFELTCFFFLGAETAATFNSFVLSVAWLKQFLGPSVLSTLGFCQFLPSILVMLAAVLARISPSKWIYTIALPVTFTYQLALNAFMLYSIVTQQPPSAAVVFTTIAINGMATGFSQSMIAALTGIFSRFSLTKGCAGMQLAGFAFGVLVPTLIQCYVVGLSAHLNADEQASAMRFGSIAVFSVAIALILLAQYFLMLLCGTTIFIYAMSHPDAADSSREAANNAKMEPLAHAPSEWWDTMRSDTASLVAGTAVLSAVTSFMLPLSTRIKVWCMGRGVRVHSAYGVGLPSCIEYDAPHLHPPLLPPLPRYNPPTPTRHYSGRPSCRPCVLRRPMSATSSRR